MNLAFTNANIKVFDSHENRVNRIDRFPKLIRDQFLNEINFSESYRYTGYINESHNGVDYITKSYHLHMFS